VTRTPLANMHKIPIDYMWFSRYRGLGSYLHVPEISSDGLGFLCCV